MIKLLVNGNEVKFETTIFPDGTSQVWKIEKDMFHDDTIQIVWMFENEAELFHVCQLATLLDNSYDAAPELICPYMPYARQDKAVSNTSSFARTVAVGLLKRAGINTIMTFDAHSEMPAVHSIDPIDFHKAVLNHDVVCFPDKGAATRYAYSFMNTPTIHFEKYRNPTTGNITHSQLIGDGVDLNDKKILIVDDICDGGATFIKVAGHLKLSSKPALIDLAVSHGLFSKGKQVLYDAGISNVFTTNSLLRNPEGFKVI